jgi:Ku protein
MAPRANWKGYLRLSLVSCPIALYPASSLSEKVSFNRLNRKTGNRLKQQNVDSETGEVVPREDTARGYEVAKGQYLIVEDEDLTRFRSKALAPSTLISLYRKPRSMSATSTRPITSPPMARLGRMRSR